MKSMGIHQGVITYVSSDNAALTKQFDVYYNAHLYEENLRELLQARQVASLRKQETGADSFEAYSMLDRLRILGDVAPYSEEYKQKYCKGCLTDIN